MQKTFSITPDTNAIGHMRLLSQQVSFKRYHTVREVVAWMGAIQAQDLNSALLAIALRLPETNIQAIIDALDKGEIIRTHILRPTWHIVAAEDYGAFMQLTSPQIRAALRYRRADAGIDHTLFGKSNPVLREMLSNGNHLTREQIAEGLTPVIRDLDSTKMNHILLENELDCTICSGRIINKQATYALVSEMLKDDALTAPVSKENALKKLAFKYFSSHGPATISDLIWWSGLTAGECRMALELAKPELASFTSGKTVYWYNAKYTEPDKAFNERAPKPDLHLLPAYDEFIIAYKDRSLVISDDIQAKAISSNGVFRPVVVYDGKVVGLWSKKTGSKKTTININWLIRPAEITEEDAETAKQVLYTAGV